MPLLSGGLQRPASTSEAFSARRTLLHGRLPRLQSCRRSGRLHTRASARYDAAEAVAEGDGGAAVAAVHSAVAPAAEQADAGGWRSWLPFSWVTSSSGSSNGNGAPKSSIASSEPALALLDSDGMAAALAPTGLTALQLAQLSPALEAELDAVAQQAAQRQEKKPAVPAEGPTVLVRGAVAPPAAAESAAEAAAAAQQGESPLLLPGGIPLHHPVLELLRQRKWEGSSPGARSDPYKLGLVLEGGGMRGAVNGGALQVLNQLGMRDAFDAVYGASAGALNATYFLSGQLDGVSIYHDYLCTGEFLNLRRLGLLRRPPEGAPPALDLSFLIDHVMHSVHPLDWDAVLASPLPLKVVASSLDTLDSVLLSNFRSKEDLVSCLKASAAVPEVAGGFVEHRGHRLVDAAVFEAIPFRSAIADGCTHVLVLNNLPKPAERQTYSGWLAGHAEDALIAAVKRLVLSPDWMRPAWEAEVEYAAKAGLREDYLLLRALDEDARDLPVFRGAHVLPLYPGPAAGYSPLCTDAATIRTGIEEGRRLMLSLVPALFPGFPPALTDSTNNILLAPRGLGTEAQQVRQAA